MRFQSYLAKMAGVAVIAAAAFVTPALATESPQEQANKKLVLDFYAALDKNDATGNTAKNAKETLEKYLGPDYYQHSDFFRNLPGVGSDRDKLIQMFQSRPAMKGPAPTGPAPKVKTLAIMAEGDLVMFLRSREMPDPATGKLKSSFIFNMFRVRDGKLVEHWDVSPGAAPATPAGAPPAGAPPAGAPPGPPPGKN